MYRKINERLMTVEEAMHVSQASAGPREKFGRPSVWAWQTVARAMAQTVTDAQIDAQIDAMLRKSRWESRKRYPRGK